jgi:NAD(P)-dependent dehydrogenase (short-subunit alcohol dehydrogenase family)
MLDMFKLKGKVSIVTGACGMLGQKHLEILASAGSNLVVADMTDNIEEVADRIANEYDVKTLPVKVDISKKDQVLSMVEQAWKRFDKIDILINNAGFTVKGAGGRFEDYFARFEDYPLDLWESALQTNITGTMLCCQAVSRTMLRQRNGVILNIASIAASSAPDHRIYEGITPPYGLKSFNNPPSYMTSKAAVVGLTKYLAAYWQGTGIRINSLSPGGVFDNHDPKFEQNYSRRVPMGRMAKKDEYQGAVLFLVSDASSYMTGADVVADGGLSVW